MYHFRIGMMLLGLAIGSASLAQMWEWQNPSPQGNLLTDVDATGLQTAWAVAQAGAILHTRDGGAHWDLQASGTSNDLTNVDFVDANHGWITGGWGTILRTSDGGMHWTQQSSGTTNWLYGLSFVDTSHGWAAGDGLILHTSNGGATWSPQPFVGSCYFFSVHFVSATQGWAVGERDMVASALITRVTGERRGNTSPAPSTIRGHW